MKTTRPQYGDFSSLLLVVCFVFPFVTPMALAGEPVISAGEPGKVATGGFVRQLPPEVAAMVKQQHEDERRITIREANLFHRHFIDACMKGMPKEVTFAYNGLLATDNGRGNLEISLTDEVYIATPLHWGVADKEGLGIFNVWISTQRTTQSVAKCTLDKRLFFVNVDFVKGLRSVDEKLPELAGRSVREVLSKIEKPSRNQSTKPK